ncbi:MAG: epoxide hydrolase N-terminal domain-containing protein, partial [Gemmatimonadaceae bacterium]
MTPHDGPHSPGIRSREWRRRLTITATIAGCGVVALAATRPTSNETTMTTTMTEHDSAAKLASDAIRPFHANVPEAAITDLRRRLAATRWPDKETAGDNSQGPQLAQLQELVKYWATGYDWRKGEAKLNALPQFITNIDGVDIHFIHVKSKNPNAMPMLISHGWPGSVFEQIKLIDPLTDPTKYGGRAE